VTWQVTCGVAGSGGDMTGRKVPHLDCLRALNATCGGLHARLHMLQQSARLVP
jgi:hypothetical protein